MDVATSFSFTVTVIGVALLPDHCLMSAGHSDGSVKSKRSLVEKLKST